MTKNLLIILTMIVMGGLLAMEGFGGIDYLVPLASAGPIFTVARLVILALLGSLLIWTPPRSRQMRQGLGVAAGASIAGVMWLVSINAVNVIDMMLLMLVSVIFAIEALELEPVNQPSSQTAA